MLHASGPPDAPSTMQSTAVTGPRSSTRHNAGRWHALALALALQCPLVAAAGDEPAPLPRLEELEAAGATIGTVHVVTRDIFDLADPKEHRLLFRWANALHMQTRPEVIERALLFKSGDRLSVRQLEETERVLRGTRYVYDVKIRPVAWHDGIVDIEVETRDTWSLDPGLSVGRSGGTNSSGIHLKEYNLLGTGVSLSLGHFRNVDRSGNEFLFSNDHAFGTWTAVSYSHAQNSDGRRDAAAVVRPFYALDTRWAAGLTASKDDRLEAVYANGAMTAGYRHRQSKAELFGGWSPGLVDGWVHRWSLGLSFQNDTYAQESGQVAPAQLPADRKRVAPCVRHELIEDRSDRQLNRNLIGRPEFFALGLASTVQLGWATTALGSNENALLYQGAISHGFEPWLDHMLIAAAKINGELVGGQVQRQQLGAQAQYYLPQGRRWLFYASAAGDVLTHPRPTDALLLGGDNGLRGYPLRYQGGDRRALFTVEERFYTDLYVWRLFRIGGAAFVDAGRAWGGGQVNTVNPGWLGDAGVGLRIVSARAAFSSVLHIDVAVPFNTAPDMKKVQFLVKTKTSF